MNEKTTFLLIFVVSTALLLYVEATDNSDDQNQNNPEYQESSDTHNTVGDYAQPIQDESRRDVLSY